MSRSVVWKRLKGWPGWALLAIVLVALLAFGAGRDGGPQTPEERGAEEISKRLACPVCDGESVSLLSRGTTLSVAICDQIRTDVDAGQLSDDDIVAVD